MPRFHGTDIPAGKEDQALAGDKPAELKCPRIHGRDGRDAGPIKNRNAYALPHGAILGRGAPGVNKVPRGWRGPSPAQRKGRQSRVSLGKSGAFR